MPNILALDTTAGACSVALRLNGKVFERSVMAAREHTLHLLPMVDSVLADAKASLASLDAIAFGAGPGSFTGLRIACGVAQGLGFGANLPLVPVSSLAAIAAEVFAQQPTAEYCLAAFDARMQQIYAGVYRNEHGLPVLLEDEVVIEPENYILPLATGVLHAAGSGLAFVDVMPNVQADELCSVNTQAEVKASAVLRIAEYMFSQGEIIAAHDAEPAYLRQQVSWKKQT